VALYSCPILTRVLGVQEQQVGFNQGIFPAFKNYW